MEDKQNWRTVCISDTSFALQSSYSKMLEHTPTSGTTRLLSLFVVPRACEGNATSGTDPAMM